MSKRSEELIGIAIGLIDAVEEVIDDLVGGDIVTLRFGLVGGAVEGFAEVFLHILRFVPDVDLQNNLKNLS